MKISQRSSRRNFITQHPEKCAKIYACPFRSLKYNLSRHLRWHSLPGSVTKFPSASVDLLISSPSFGHILYYVDKFSCGLYKILLFTHLTDQRDQTAETNQKLTMLGRPVGDFCLSGFGMINVGNKNTFSPMMV